MAVHSGAGGVDRHGFLRDEALQSVGIAEEFTRYIERGAVGIVAQLQAHHVFGLHVIVDLDYPLDDPPIPLRDNLAGCAALGGFLENHAAFGLDLARSVGQLWLLTAFQCAASLFVHAVEVFHAEGIATDRL